MKRNNILYPGRWDDYRGLSEPTVFVEGTYRKEFGKEESDRMDDELIAKIKTVLKSHNIINKVKSIHYSES
jgi:hypothetical protein